MPAELNIPTRLETPKGLRIHIGLFGRRNAGKSSLINALTNQQIAIVSDVPGTTTDPVEKPVNSPPSVLLFSSIPPVSMTSVSSDT